ncbi:MAG: hypothetical protein WBM83_03685, partial [Flavobacteriaceae bacterium]
MQTKFIEKYRLKGIATLLLCFLLTACTEPKSDTVDLTQATLLYSPSIKEATREIAHTILTEEIAKRTDLSLTKGDAWGSKTSIALVLSSDAQLYTTSIPKRASTNPEFEKEGYRLVHETNEGSDILWVIGADSRGLLYG